MGDALRARATHALHRARIPGLGLAVGIAIALSGCNPVFFGSRCDEQKARWIADAERCQSSLSPSLRAPDGSWHEDAFKACSDAAFYTSVKVCDRASGMSASGQDPQGLEAKPASPTAESGDAQ